MFTGWELKRGLAKGKCSAAVLGKGHEDQSIKGKQKEGAKGVI